MNNTNLHFENLATAYLYINELAGQISDGKYENMRPYDHWKWVTNVNIFVDNTKGCNGDRWYGPSWARRYNLKEWPGYIKRSMQTDKPGYSDYTWAWRVFYGAKFMHLFDNESQEVKNNVLETVQYLGYYFENMIWRIGEAVRFNKNITFDEFVNDYNKLKNEKPLCELINETTFNAYKNSTYTLKNLTNDLKSMAESVNTYLPEKTHNAA